MQTIPLLTAAFNTIGSDVLYHRESGGTACPCRTLEGFRDPAWHHVHPEEPVCNEQGFLAIVTEFMVKASIQAALTRYFRMAARPERDIGWVESDDKIGIFPVYWNGNTLDFRHWSDGGEDFVVYDGERYTCVTADKMADVDGDPNHHWEVSLRLMKTVRVNSDSALVSPGDAVGTHVYEGEGPPPVDLVWAINDLYLDTLTGDLYKRVA